LTLVALIALGCTAPPPDPSQWDGARMALGRAVRELRPVDAAAAEEVERLVADAERATAAEAAAPPWRRDPGRGAAAWNRAARTARGCLAEVRTLRGLQARRLEQLLISAESRIDAAGNRIGRSGVSGRNAGQVAAGRTHVATARKLAAHGEYSAALDHATQALAVAAELDAAWSRNHERFSDPTLVALWRGIADATVQDSRRTGSTAIVVDKLHRRVLLYRAGRRVAQFDAELGANGLERKRFSGDRATPEGRYRVSVKKSGGATKYYLALLIDYPNSDDQRRYREGIADGSIPPKVGIGGLIEIHGGGGSGRDWTDGCVALTNEDMDRLFPQVRVGTPVTIVGTL
jgi:L,D-peptidoglycan transpeptidase YkuD (ErfK/YbiS/YcfS/YnhG family)